MLDTTNVRSLREKQKAVFLDRDGTINEHVRFLRKIDDFKLLSGVAKAIAKTNASSYLAFAPSFAWSLRKRSGGTEKTIPDGRV